MVRPVLVATCLLLITSGCLGPDGSGDGGRFLVYADEGFEAPHPFRVESSPTTLAFVGLFWTAETRAFTVTSHLDPATLGGPPMQGPALVLDQAFGTVTASNGTHRFEGASLVVAAPRLTFTGPMTITGPWPAAWRNGTWNADGAASSAWAALEAEDNLTIGNVTVAFLDGDGARPGRPWHNATIDLDRHQRARIRGADLRIALDGIHVQAAEDAGSARHGYRTADSFGIIALGAPPSGYRHTVEIRDRVARVNESVTIHFDRINDVAMSTNGGWTIEGRALQIMTGAAGRIEAAVQFDHPHALVDLDVVVLRVPPRVPFQSVLAVRETSGVGAALAVRPQVVSADAGMNVTFGTAWRDQREAPDDDLEPSALEAFRPAEGSVHIGPHETVFLPFWVTVNGSADAYAADVEIVAQNARTAGFTIEATPDDAAPRSDEPRGRDAPAVSIGASLTALAAALILTRRVRRA